MSVVRQLPAFALAGAVGFLVDAGILYAAMDAGLDYYGGRVVSFCAAVMTTWLINRHWTFAAVRARPSMTEFARYFGAMVLGGAVNYATYAIVVATLPRTAWLPLAAVAAGSIAGLGVNFATARAGIERWPLGVKESLTNSVPRWRAGVMPNWMLRRVGVQSGADE